MVSFLFWRYIIFYFHFLFAHGREHASTREETLTKISLLFLGIKFRGFRRFLAIRENKFPRKFKPAKIKTLKVLQNWVLQTQVSRPHGSWDIDSKQIVAILSISGRLRDIECNETQIDKWCIGDPRWEPARISNPLKILEKKRRSLQKLILEVWRLRPVQGEYRSAGALEKITWSAGALRNKGSERRNIGKFLPRTKKMNKEQNWSFALF